MERRRFLVVAAATSLGATGSVVASSGALAADNWPDRPLRMVIPWPPGGGNDIVGRIVAARMSQAFGQPVVVENRGGSNGVMGAEVVAKSRPDGYTIMFHSVTSHVVNAAIFPRLPYDSARDFVPAAILGQTPLAIMVSPDSGIRSLPELIARIRAAPGQLSYASFGNGSAAHLAGELFKQQLGLEMVHVPYRGGAQALTDTISGVVTMNFGGINTTASALRAGQVVPLALTTERRSPSLPEVPTVQEAAGITGYDVAVLYALWVPAGTPEEIVTRIAAESAGAMQDPGVLARLRTNGVEPLPPMTAAERVARVAREADVLGRVARAAQVKVD